MGLRDTVTVADVDHAYQLWFGAMSRAARDAEGRLTMTAFTEGGAVSGEKRWMAEALPALLRSILQGEGVGGVGGGLRSGGRSGQGCAAEGHAAGGNVG
jgi:hypothetical protein